MPSLETIESVSHHYDDPETFDDDIDDWHEFVVYVPPPTCSTADDSPKFGVNGFAFPAQ